MIFIPTEEKVTKVDKTFRENNGILKTTLIFNKEEEFEEKREIREEGERGLPNEEQKEEEPYRLRNRESLARPTRLTDYYTALLSMED